MKHAFVSKSGEARVIVIFAGWGMDSRPFADLRRPGYDILVVWDYRSLEFSSEWVAGYSEVCLLAWSMGVSAAAQCVRALGACLTARIAVAGTLTPVHDTTGIPEHIFNSTLQTLDERNLQRFMRRMCGGAKAYSEFAARAPRRNIDELRDELVAIASRPISLDMRFDHYVLTTRDAIFPPEAQRQAFHDTDIVETDSPHLPDFQALLDEFFIDKTLVADRFEAAQRDYDENAEAQTLIAAYLANQLRDKDTAAILNNPQAKVLEIGCGTGLLSRRIAGLRPKARMHYWDIAPVPPVGISSDAYRCCDAEMAMRHMPDNSLDLIVSASTMQWFNSPEQFLAHALRAIRPGGFLAISTFAAGNLPEIKSAAGITLRLSDPGTWHSFITSALPSAELIALTPIAIQCRFPSAMHALRHLSLTGVNALRRSPRSARAIAACMQPDAGGCYPLTYSTLFIIIRKKP